jgi:hypothetical protein
MNISELSRQILMHGLTDWVQMSEVASVAKGLIRDATQDELRDQCVRAIGELRDGNLVRVGDLAREGFTAWTGETKCILVRIDAEWRALGTPRLGDIAWLETTPVGNRIGIVEWEKWRKQQDKAEKK